MAEVAGATESVLTVFGALQLAAMFSQASTTTDKGLGPCTYCLVAASPPRPLCAYRARAVVRVGSLRMGF